MPRPDYEVGLGRRVAMRMLSLRAGHAVKLQLTDSTSGFRAIARPMLEHFAHEYPTEYLGDTVEALVVAGHVGGTRRRASGADGAAQQRDARPPEQSLACGTSCGYSSRSS